MKPEAFGHTEHLSGDHHHHHHHQRDWTRLSTRLLNSNPRLMAAQLVVVTTLYGRHSLLNFFSLELKLLLNLVMNSSCKCYKQYFVVAFDIVFYHPII